MDGVPSADGTGNRVERAMEHDRKVATVDSCEGGFGSWSKKQKSSLWLGSKDTNKGNKIELESLILAQSER